MAPERTARKRSTPRRRAAGTAVHYLECDTCVIGDVRFPGCCLWADYALNGMRDRSMALAGRVLRDHRVIRIRDNERFRPGHALAEHEQTLCWLWDELAKPFEGRPVVVTHHGVAPPSVHPRYADDPVDTAFVSDLGPLLELADVWIHGHVHDSFDYRVGQSRVIASPPAMRRTV